MIHHPMINDLSNKSLEELQDTISKLNNNLSFAAKMHNQALVNQLNLALNSYRSEYARRQQELWNKKMDKLSGKIDIKNSSNT